MGSKDKHSGAVMREGQNEDQLGGVCQVQQEMTEAYARGLAEELMYLCSV